MTFKVIYRMPKFNEPKNAYFDNGKEAEEWISLTKRFDPSMIFTKDFYNEGERFSSM
jgi:hypothetical protein